MADEEGTPRRRRRGPRGRLRRFQEIDHVVVERPFALRSQEEAGEGCYVSATINNKRYYGILVEQSAIQEASQLFFQNEANGLELNKRMEMLRHKAGVTTNGVDVNGHSHEDSTQNPPSHESEDNPPKRQRIESPQGTNNTRLIQKFQYVETQAREGHVSTGYRLLLATYSDVAAAAEGDRSRKQLIDEACKAGGGFVGECYYQFEDKGQTLVASETAFDGDNGVRLSMGFDSFMKSTPLPEWYPLSNISGSQSKVLDMLSMKKDHNGNLVWDQEKTSTVSLSQAPSVSRVPMEDRKRYRVAVAGGGIAGLSCCLELLQHCEREGIDVEVTLLEARNRLGGRLWTDRTAFKGKGGTDYFPVDLGASWIHGIELNPLAALAREAGVDFVTTSEEVIMLQAGMKQVNKEEDDRAGNLFDQLLDYASNHSWETSTTAIQSQAAIRWYARVFASTETADDPLKEAAADHRRSDDTSVDEAIGRAIEEHLSAEYALLSDTEKKMLFWNLKNVEYALGANIADLSMKFWDIDESHAFEGAHVILKQGYSTIVDYLALKLRDYGDRFTCKQEFPIAKIEYARKTTVATFAGGRDRQAQYVDLSDTCRLSSVSGEAVCADFTVCALPLGVLKEAVANEDNSLNKSSIAFEPRLPFSKRDAIASVGFGLLDKVYMQFDTAFWRVPGVLESDQTIFGNATGVNPHQYMFFDIGKALDSSVDSPAILMCLISGKEAVACEMKSDEGIRDETMTTLRTLFDGMTIPDPTVFKATRWGQDPFARGSYTFLPPGTTDQDFHILRSPLNGNGDSLLLDRTETMRLFFAGEHTTSLHPSMAHGAMLSGIRAAKEVVAAMSLSPQEDTGCDRVLPIPLFRHQNPTTPLVCCLCNIEGSTVREGTLLAFTRGARQILVHNNCAENSPEVEVDDGQWKDVIKACNRSKNIECVMCRHKGASVGCLQDYCGRCFHVSCAEDTGWRFDEDGKEYYCDLHRTDERDEPNRVSIDFYKMRTQPDEPLQCSLCGRVDDDKVCGSILAFRQKGELCVVHENCAQKTNVADTSENTASRMDNDFQNIFLAIERSRLCSHCQQPGASTSCSWASCDQIYHYPCAVESGFKFSEKGDSFRCTSHRGETAVATKQEPDEAAVADSMDTTGMDFFQHALFSLTEESNEQEASVLDSGPAMQDTDIAPGSPTKSMPLRVPSDELPSSDDADEDSPTPISLDRISLSTDTSGRGQSLLVRSFRASATSRWSMEFFVTLDPASDRYLLTVADVKPSMDGLMIGDIINSFNGVPIGSPDLDTMSKVLNSLSQEVDILMEIQRPDP